MTQPIPEATERYAVEPESIELWRGTVYFENLALWKEKDPPKRAVMSRQLAEWTGILAEMEAAEAQKALEAPPAES